MQPLNHVIFDRALHKLHLKRCCENYTEHSFLINEIAEDVEQRIADFTRDFEKMMIYGLFSEIAWRKPSNEVIRGFLIPEMKNAIKSNDESIIFDEEHNELPNEAFDLIVSNLSLSFVNDIPGALVQYKNALKPNGIFMATFFGTETLKELKEAFLKVDDYYFKGSMPHIIPFIDIVQGADLLKRAGFVEAISDSNFITVDYSSLSTLFKDIKYIGQSNCLHRRNKGILPKDYFKKLEEIYISDYNLRATFEIVTITGLKL
jgi:SAM-dependent methyltransferase